MNMPPKKPTPPKSPRKGMAHIRAFRKYAEPYRPHIEQHNNDEDEPPIIEPKGKKSAKPPPAKKAKKVNKAEKASEKAGEKAAEKAAVAEKVDEPIVLTKKKTCYHQEACTKEEVSTNATPSTTV